MLNMYESIIMGVIQGITEWLPVSSEGVVSLVLINVFSRDANQAVPFALWLHGGTLLAAIVYFRYEISGVFNNIPSYFKVDSRSHYKALTNFLIISTIITGILGFPIILFGFDKINLVSASFATVIIGLLLIITGLFQFSLKEQSLREKDDIAKKDAVLTGILQAFAIFPGLSRSGLTITYLLMRKYSAGRAFSLSFLMSIPIVIIGEIYFLISREIIIDINSLAAIAASFITGLATINILMKISRKFNFGYIVIGLGVLSVLVGLVSRIS